MRADQGDGRDAAVVDVGLVDDHRDVGLRAEDALDRVDRQQTSGRRIRVGENDRPGARRRVVVGLDFEGVVERYGGEGDIVQTAIHRVEAVGDVRKQHRPGVPEQAR